MAAQMIVGSMDHEITYDKAVIILQTVLVTFAHPNAVCTCCSSTSNTALIMLI